MQYIGQPGLLSISIMIPFVEVNTTISSNSQDNLLTGTTISTLNSLESVLHTVDSMIFLKPVTFHTFPLLTSIQEHSRTPIIHNPCYGLEAPIWSALVTSQNYSPTVLHSAEWHPDILSFTGHLSVPQIIKLGSWLRPLYPKFFLPRKFSSQIPTWPAPFQCQGFDPNVIILGTFYDYVV